ncbi:MAG TPA: cell division protein CrgA [Propionibacteriaceae bacterium]|nr:cell division protein CrgA [Propionibacteriaceae bacterium]
MPESRTRKAADEKRKLKRAEILAEDRQMKQRRTVVPGQRAWVPPLFITVGLLGVAWLVVYYVAGSMVPLMKDWGNWNILIAMGLIAAAFSLATLWK